MHVYRCEQFTQMNKLKTVITVSDVSRLLRVNDFDGGFIDRFARCEFDTTNPGLDIWTGVKKEVVKLESKTKLEIPGGVDPRLRGIAFEHKLCEFVEQCEGTPVEQLRTMRKDHDDLTIVGRPDGLIDTGGATVMVEFKIRGRYGGVRDYDFIAVQLYFFLLSTQRVRTQVRTCFFVEWVNGTVNYYTIERNDDFINQVLEEVKQRCEMLSGQEQTGQCQQHQSTRLAMTQERMRGLTVK